MQFIDDDVKNIGHSSSNGSIKDSQNGTPNLVRPQEIFARLSAAVGAAVVAAVLW